MHAHGLSTSTRSCDCFGAVGGGRASMVPVVIFAVLHLVSVWNSGLTDGGGGGGGGDAPAEEEKKEEEEEEEADVGAGDMFGGSDY
mmetsp:Transcript_96413/g.170815  ORF Transcript_96413/g.170815 Transcript_96413/m.170815 type:complete len:86 (+) Transcript_96413:297-554(+)